MNMKNLFDLQIDQLEHLYDAEEQLEAEFSKLVKEASTPALKKLLEKNLKVTKSQIERLNEIGQDLGVKIEKSKKVCAALRGVLKESQEIRNSKPESHVLDAALILTAQKAAHYHMASYGSARAYARALGSKRTEALLEKSLDEEKGIDRELSELAIKTVNQSAVRPAKAA